LFELEGGELLKIHSGYSNVFHHNAFIDLGDLPVDFTLAVDYNTEGPENKWYDNLLLAGNWWSNYGGL